MDIVRMKTWYCSTVEKVLTWLDPERHGKEAQLLLLPYFLTLGVCSSLVGVVTFRKIAVMVSIALPSVA